MSLWGALRHQFSEGSAASSHLRSDTAVVGETDETNNCRASATQLIVTRDCRVERRGVDLASAWANGGSAGTIDSPTRGLGLSQAPSHVQGVCEVCGLRMAWDYQ